MWNPFGSSAKLSPELAARVPPNQRLTDGFPILHEGAVPELSPANWDLRIWGLVAREQRLSWADFMALPQTKLVSDFHCVTGWSKLDNVWEGVRFSELAARVGVKPEARFVVAYGQRDDDPLGYDTNLPLSALMDDDVLLARAHNGRPLTPEHGYPVRLVVPKRYAWKSAKWLRGLEFLAEDRRGYWEVRGYHNQAEPFAEERYASQERPEERMHVRGKDHS
jgi:DMSO/TMAO reductase YedYZ molybdopterin-dependent catalytic subunit